MDDFIKGDYFENITHFHLSNIPLQKLAALPRNLKVLSFQQSQLTD